MPPRKKINKIVNEEVEKKIKSFVNTANEKDCESSDEEYNIYVKSAQELSTPKGESTQVLTEPTPVPEKVVKSKPRAGGTSKKAPRAKILPEKESDPNEKLYKMFDEYKNELNELRNIVVAMPLKEPQSTPSVILPPTPVIDVRRAMMQLKFG